MRRHSGKTQRIAVGLLATAGLWPLAAAAFVQSTTGSGAPISWPKRSLTIYLNEQGSDDVALPDVQAAVEASIAPWPEPECTDLELTYGGLTSRADVGFRTSGANINLVVWQEEEWIHADGVIAVTTVTYCTEAGGACTYNGTVLDADIEMNGTAFRFTHRAEDRVLFDIANTLTHEVGHFLGLDHTPIREATMYASAPPGETRKRTLHSDDIEGLCHIYPVGEPSPFEGALASKDDGCQAAPGVPAGGFPWGLLLLGGVLVWRRERRPA